jgi:hypothetical protein
VLQIEGDKASVHSKNPSLLLEVQLAAKLSKKPESCAK